MSAILFLAAIVGMALWLAYGTGEDVFDTLPFATGAGILLLYLLAFLRGLPLAGPLACAGAAACFAAGRGRSASPIPERPGLHPLYVRTRPQASANRMTERLPRMSRVWTDPPFLLAALLIVCAGALASARVVTWWDDLNFWANDAKFLWYMGGFAGKYGNVSPEFGDYPPAQALWKWVFLALSPEEYREGLQYSAYHILNLIFLLPLLTETRHFRPFAARLLAVPAVFLLPGAFCGMQFDGAAADVSMACVFGALLLAIGEHRGKTSVEGASSKSLSESNESADRARTIGVGSVAIQSSDLRSHLRTQNHDGIKDSCGPSAQVACESAEDAARGAKEGILSDSFEVAQSRDGLPRSEIGGRLECAKRCAPGVTVPSMTEQLSGIAHRMPFGHTFRLARIAVYGSVLVLTKNTGILWLGAALLYWILVPSSGGSAEKVPDPSSPGAGREGRAAAVFGEILAGAALPLTVWGSWILFCLRNRRVAKLTGEGLRMARRGFVLPPDWEGKLRAFREAFVSRPLHGETGPVLDLSPLGLIVLWLIACLILTALSWAEPLRPARPGPLPLRFRARLAARAGRVTEQSRCILPFARGGEPLRLLVWTLLVGAGIYGGIVLAHLTVFQTEGQYLEAYDMSLSIARYGVPFALGSAMLLLRELAKRASAPGSAGPEPAPGSAPGGPSSEPAPGSVPGGPPPVSALALAAFLAFPLLTADYPGELRAFVTYRETREEALVLRAQTIDPEAGRFLAAMKGRRDLWGRRVLFLRDGTKEHRVRDTWVGYEACPIPVVFGDYFPGMGPEEMEEAARTAHAATYYVDEALLLLSPEPRTLIPSDR